jgi:beta-galactosidase/beta-glucuronidase
MKINVPFCPESKLSGVERTDFMLGVWYKRDFEIPADWSGKRVLLHVGACDYHARVYVNGKFVGEHKGGYTPFELDITDKLCEGKNRLTVYAEDDTRDMRFMSGKQCVRYESYGCSYTRTTGIWQSVWLEAADAARVVKYRAYPDIENAAVTLAVETTEFALGATLSVKALFDGREVGSVKTKIASRVSTVSLPLT